VPASSHPLLRDLGSHIRRLRLARGWSQEELAHRAGIDRSYMSGIERGVRNATVLSLHRVARALGVELADVLGPGPPRAEGARTGGGRGRKRTYA
jgi:transcriptional regulator with XRE-family HTH domain